jgi:RNA polymerase sigma factor (sigma-70 family)
VSTGHATRYSTSSGQYEVLRQPAFLTTHWSVVLAAGSDHTRGREALERLCRTYWFPLYAYVRRRGYSPEDAQDLTQEFFARLLTSHSLGNADPNRGKFRAFLLGAMNHCLADEWAKLRAQKRGGGRSPIPLDLTGAEHRFQAVPADDAAPDQAFDRHWATALLNEVLTRLEGEYRRDAKAGLFDALRQTLIGAREAQPYAILGKQLGLGEGAVRTAVHRLRKRYRELIRDEIANTVSSPEEVEAEIRYLFRMSAATH